MDPITDRLGALLRLAVERGASDVHLKVPSKPLMRIDGELVRIEELERVMPPDAEDYLASMLAGLPHSAKQMEFEARGEVDFTSAYAGVGRFRVNAYRQRGSITLVLRPVRFEIPRLADLGLPAELAELSAGTSGLILICGPAGSGVTTTVAALIDVMNDGPPRNVIMVEDPIEVLHTDRRCTINQREVGLDTASVADGLARVLRHDPDVLVLGGIDDLATAEIVVNAAANGVLVIAVMSTAEPRESVERLIDLYPLHRQAVTRGMLASALRAVACQRLVARDDGRGRRPVVDLVSGADRLRHLVLRTDADAYGAAEPPLGDAPSPRPAAIAVGSPAAISR